MPAEVRESEPGDGQHDVREGRGGRDDDGPHSDGSLILSYFLFSSISAVNFEKFSQPKQNLSQKTAACQNERRRVLRRQRRPVRDARPVERRVGAGGRHQLGQELRRREVARRVRQRLRGAGLDRQQHEGRHLLSEVEGGRRGPAEEEKVAVGRQAPVVVMKTTPMLMQ